MVAALPDCGVCARRRFPDRWESARFRHVASIGAVALFLALGHSIKHREDLRDATKLRIGAGGEHIMGRLLATQLPEDTLVLNDLESNGIQPPEIFPMVVMVGRACVLEIAPDAQERVFTPQDALRTIRQESSRNRYGPQVLELLAFRVMPDSAGSARKRHHTFSSG